MKALIQKDLRENLKVALIGLLIFSLLLLQTYQSSISQLTRLLGGYMSGEADSLQPLLSKSLLAEAAFFCAIFGTALGWFQTRNEAHRDLWAFLIHRPVTRAEIFLGKTIAGLGLYAFGAGLPLAVLVAVVRTPGHIAAPFEWAMVLPAASIFLTGVGYYFAGLLTGLRQARWYASRSFGLGLAIFASVGLFSLPQYWMSLGLIVIAIGVLAAAAWGGYQTGGFYRGQPMAGKLALAVALAAGCSLVLFVGMGLLFGLVIEPLSYHPSVYRRYEMTRAGTIYRETMQDGELVEVGDLDGKPLLDPKTGQKMDRKEFQKLAAYGSSVSTNFKKRRPGQYAILYGPSFFSLCNTTDKTLWYLDRHGKLIGYDGRMRKSIGSLEPHGADGASASEPFLRNPNAYYYYNSYDDASRKLLATARSVYRVDFKERTLKLVYTLTNDDEIGGYADSQAFYNDSQVKNLLFTTHKIVCLLDSEGQALFTAPYKPVYPEYPQVQVSLLQPTNRALDNFAIWFYPDYEMNRAAGWKMPVHVAWMAADQGVTKNIDLLTLRQPGGNSWPDELAMALLTPPAYVEFNHRIHRPWNLLSYALAAACAVIGWWRSRRYHFSTGAAAGWAVFIFLLGIAGLLAFLCVQEWPAREACPNCKKLRAVDRESCEHCAAPFSPPEKNGTEIFGPLVKV